MKSRTETLRLMIWDQDLPQLKQVILSYCWVGLGWVGLCSVLLYSLVCPFVFDCIAIQ